MDDEFKLMQQEFESGEGKSRRVWKPILGLLLLLMATGGGYLLFAHFADEASDQPAVPVLQNTLANAEAEARSALARGDYNQASAVIERNQLGEPGAWLKDTLTVTFLFNYDLPQPAIKRDGRLQLPAGTTYYAAVKPEERCYLYLLSRDAAGVWRQLLPDADLPNGANPMAPLHQSIPDTGRFDTPGSDGTITFYLTASRWRQQGLEKMIQNTLHSAGQEKPLLDYFTRQREAMQKYPGIVCKELAFDHNL